MTKYVLLEFDSDEQANKYVKKLILEADTADKQKPYRVVGLFKPPSSWCQCPRTAYSEKNSTVRGDKYGWWVHLTCRKSRLGTHALKNLVSIPGQTRFKEDTYYLVDNLTIHETPTLVKKLREAE